MSGSGESDAPLIDSVRSWIGDGHERFSDDWIIRIASTMPYPTGPKVGARIWSLYVVDGVVDDR